MLGRDDLVIDGACDDSLHLVAKLPDIALPIADHQHIDRLRRERDIVLAESLE